MSDWLRASLFGCAFATLACGKAAPSTTPPVPDSNSATTPTPLALPDDDPYAVPRDDDAAQLQLPASPAFVESQAPVQYPDGVFSVRGLREDIDANVQDGDAGIEIRLRAYVLEVYVAPDCPEDEICPPPKQPHVWVVDHPEQRGKRRAMLVANYRFSIPEWDSERWKGLPDVVLEPGKQYTFKGKFRRFTDTGFASDRGVLEFVAYEQPAPDGGTRWVHPLNAPWDPLEVSRMEKENAELAEKARRAIENRKKGNK